MSQPAVCSSIIWPLNSKATNKKVWYHGSDTKIDKFSLDFITGGKSNLDYGPGIYFTDDINDAKRYGKYIHTVTIGYRKAKVLPKQKYLPAFHIAYQLVDNPKSNFKTDFDNWGETKQQALNAVVNAYKSFGKSDFRYVLNSIWNDFYTGKEKEFCEVVLEAYDCRLEEKYRDWETDRKSTRLNSSH